MGPGYDELEKRDFWKRSFCLKKFKWVILMQQIEFDY